MTFKKTAKVLVMLILVMATMLSMCAFKIPDGVSVTGYDPNVDYMAKMRDCAKDGSDSALKMGAIYEEQRNQKIDDLGMSYKKTTFFASTNDVKELVSKIDDYISPKKAETELKYYFTEDDAVMLAKLLFRECGGVNSKVEQACVVWTVLNRVDCKYDGCTTIASVVTAPKQFAYSSGTTVRQDLYDLAYDVLTRWNLEKNGQTDVGRVLPSNYLFLHGDGRHNYFKTSERSSSYWDYSLPSPY